jgi:nucleoside-diphosphate-sugar epimerase
MRIFITGGTGSIGAAVVDGLVRAGHTVTALVRNGEKARAVAARGAAPVIGDLARPESYVSTAVSQEGYVHAAFEGSTRGPELDRQTIETLVQLASHAGRGTPFLYTSGVWILGSTLRPVDESAPVNPPPHLTWRPAHEQVVLGAASVGVRPIVVRPGIVYGGAHGLVGDLFRDAANGLIRVIGAGDNHWPLVYDRDLADLYTRLLASGDASGVYHANDEGDERVNDLVEAIAAHRARRPGIRHVPLAEAEKKLGEYARALALDQRVRSPRARALGWTPTLRSVSRNAARLFEEWRRARDN